MGLRVASRNLMQNGSYNYLVVDTTTGHIAHTDEVTLVQALKEYKMDNVGLDRKGQLVCTDGELHHIPEFGNTRVFAIANKLIRSVNSRNPLGYKIVNSFGQIATCTPKEAIASARNKLLYNARVYTTSDGKQKLKPPTGSYLTVTVDTLPQSILNQNVGMTPSQGVTNVPFGSLLNPRYKIKESSSPKRKLKFWR